MGSNSILIPKRWPNHKTRSTLLFLFSATLILSGVFFSAGALAEGPATFLVRATGHVPGTGFAVRNQAIALACREAVLEVLENYLPYTERYLLEEMLQHPEAYIQRYDLLRHDQDENGTRVEIDVHILEQPLFRDLARVMFPRLPHPPNILIVMGERIGPDRIVAVPDFGITETALREALENQDMSVSGVDSIVDVYSQAELITLVQGDVETGADFARENLADVVIVGTAIAQADNPDETDQLQRHRAVVQARVYRGFDGKIMEEVQAAAAVHGIDSMDTGTQAVNDACAKIADNLSITAIIAMLGKQEQDKVLIHIQNPGSQERIDQIENVLRFLPGVTQIERVFHSTARARMRVDYNGPLRFLLEAITEPLYEGEYLDTKSAIGREITVAFP